MFGNRKPTLADVEEMIAQGAAPSAVAQKFYDATMGKYYLNAGNAECALARKYGGRLTLDEIRAFKDAVKPVEDKQVLGANVIRWSVFSTEMLRGFIEAGGVKTSADAIRVCRMMSGYNVWDGYFEWLEGELIKRAVPLLVERNEVLDFALALKTYKGLMVFSIALGYAPSSTFEEALKQRQEDMRREEAERRRQNDL